jgi:hypothetical protein
MKTTRLSFAAAATLLVTTLGATMVLAQSSEPAPSPRPGHGMMGPGDMDHGSMMNMGQMHRMTDNCNRMMESAQHAPPHQQDTKPDNG